MVTICYSSLEERILSLYTRHNIFSPGDISLRIFDYVGPFHVIYREGFPLSIWKDDQYFIFVDGSQSLPERRVAIAHEIGHLLLHSGIQTWLPPNVSNKQEWQAERFAMYALTPSPMLLQLLINNIFSSRGAMVAEMAEEFGVPEKFMDKRLILFEQTTR